MKILITGATGSVGNTLLPLLCEKGHELIVLTRNSKTAKVRLPVDCKIIEWEEIAILKEESIEVVINLCGENVASSRWTLQKKQEIYDSRVLLTRNLIDYFREDSHPIQTWVSASATGIYENSIVPDESSPSGQDFLAKVCKDWEEENFKANDLNIRTTTFRIGIVLDFDGGAMKNLLPIFKLGLGGNISNGKQWMSWIHVRDVAGLIMEAIENPSYEGALNAVSPNPITNRDFTSTLGAILKRPTLFPVPGWILKFLLGEMSQIVIKSQKISPGRVKSLGYRFVYPKLKHALKVICDQPGHIMLIEQWVPQPIDKIFDFFTDPKNLEILTPNFLKFKILRTTSSPIRKGTLLDYSLKIRKIPIHWQSKITECVSEVRFSDEQTKGPYQFWYHTHVFFEKNQGTIIRDRILYKLPGWIPGDILVHWLVRKDLEKIFLYRMEVIDNLFNPKDKN